MSFAHHARGFKTSAVLRLASGHASKVYHASTAASHSTLSRVRTVTRSNAILSTDTELLNESESSNSPRQGKFDIFSWIVADDRHRLQSRKRKAARHGPQGQLRHLNTAHNMRFSDPRRFQSPSAVDRRPALRECRCQDHS